MKLVSRPVPRTEEACYDELGNTLELLARRLDGLLLRSDLAVPRVEELRRLRLLTTDALHTLRSLVESEAARRLDGETFVRSLTRLTREYAGSTGTCADLRIDGDPRCIRGRLAAVLLDITWETFANVSHDARSTIVVVRIQVDAARVVLDIADDGVDLAQRQVAAWRSAVELGLRRMSRAAQSLGGHLVVSALRPRGLRIRATFPLAPGGRA